MYWRYGVEAQYDGREAVAYTRTCTVGMCEWGRGAPVCIGTDKTVAYMRFRTDGMDGHRYEGLSY